MNGNFMKEKPVLPLILSMALPMALSMLVNSLYNIVDSFFVAQISEDAMTALSLVFPIQNFINAVGIGFGIGINAAIAFYLGAGKQSDADTAATLGLLLAILHSIVMTIGSIAIIPGFLRMFTSSEAVIDLGVRYTFVAFSFTLIIITGVTFDVRMHFKYYFRPCIDLGHRTISPDGNRGRRIGNGNRSIIHTDYLYSSIFCTSY